MNRREFVEEGSVTSTVAGIIAVLLSLTVFISALGGIYAAKVQLQAQVDMAVLGAAHKTPSSLAVGDKVACGTSEQILRLTNAHIVSCDVMQGDIWLVATRKVSVLGMSVPIRARARAGPV